MSQVYSSPYLTHVWFKDFPQTEQKNGSSGRTRTYNPPVNSLVRCRNFKNLAAQMITHGNVKNQAVTHSAILRDLYLTRVFSSQIRVTIARLPNGVFLYFVVKHSRLRKARPAAVRLEERIADCLFITIDRKG